jgi:hypothetical protein
MAIGSCTHQSSQHSNTTDTFENFSSLNLQSDTASIPLNINFPFGCTELTKLKYPEHWEGDLNHYGHLKKPGGQEFEDIKNCFMAINAAKTISAPSTKKLTLLKLGELFENANNLDTAMQLSIDSCRYRLPNLGNYECYYCYQRYGNLLLLEPKTMEGKVLNIYADDLGGDSHTNLRYFYIDKNGIRIFEAAWYDDGCFLDEKFKISIDSDGSIKINLVKK